MKKFEMYVRKEFLEKWGALLFFVVVILYPGFQSKAFGTFFLVLFGLASDLKTKRFELLANLPFKRKEIFLYSYFFGIFLIILTFFVSLPFADNNWKTLLDLLKSVNFYTFFFSTVLILVCYGFDNVGGAFLILFANLVLSSFGSQRFTYNFNPYILISPTRQANIYLATAFAFFLLFVSFKVFTKRGGE